MTGRIRCRAIIGADHMVAIVFQPFVAILTVLATIDNAADTNQITRLEAGYTLPHRRHTADNLMPRHARVYGPSPFGPHRINAEVATAAIGNANLNAVSTRPPP